MRFYADENYQEPIIFALRELGHDVLMAKEDLDESYKNGNKANNEIPDNEVLARATELDRVVLTGDRDFLDLHKKEQNHAGICFTTAAKNEDFDAVALSVNKQFEGKESLKGELIRVYNPNTSTEKAEIERLRQEHKQELEKGREKYQESKEEQKPQEKQENKEIQEQKSEQKTIYSGDDCKVEKVSEGKYLLETKDGKGFQFDSKMSETEFHNQLQDNNLRGQFLDTLKGMKINDEISSIKGKAEMDKPKIPPPPPPKQNI